MDLALRLRSGLGLGLCSMSGALSISAGESATNLQGAMAARVNAAQALQQRTPYVLTPERKALLNTIRFAEGTWKEGEEVGYRVLYGGSTFESFEKHPERVIVKRYTSAAAGAYQFLPRTWSMAANKLGLIDFGPRNQDQAALFLIERRQALQDADAGKLTSQLLAKLAPEWASLPTLTAQSYYGQPVKKAKDLQRFYNRNLEELRRQASTNGPIRLSFG
jgi:muramidase (phage lysozyme)